MGRQVGFFADDVDERSVLEHAEHIGLRGFPGSPASAAPIKLLSPADARRRMRGSRFYLVRADASLRGLAAALGPGRVGLPSDVAPLIEFKPSPTEGDVISNGRIFISNADDPATIKLYQRLARFIRQWPQTDRFRFRVGPHTAEAASARTIRLMHFRNELHVA